MFLASSCSYPKLAPQPMRPDSLLTGPLEPTNQSYAVAKLAGIQMCDAYSRQHGVEFFAAIPADAFGPGDDFSPEDSHVVAGLMRRMHEAKHARTSSVDIWGSGQQRREFIYVDDLARACVFTMRDTGRRPVEPRRRERHVHRRTGPGHQGRRRISGRASIRHIEAEACRSRRLTGQRWRHSDGGRRSPFPMRCSEPTNGSWATESAAVKEA